MLLIARGTFSVKLRGSIFNPKVRTSIHIDYMLHNAIKIIVAVQAENIKIFYDIPRPESKSQSCYMVKYVYEYILKVNGSLLIAEEVCSHHSNEPL